MPFFYTPVHNTVTQSLLRLPLPTETPFHNRFCSILHHHHTFVLPKMSHTLTVKTIRSESLPYIITSHVLDNSPTEFNPMLIQSFDCNTYKQTPIAQPLSLSKMEWFWTDFCKVTWCCLLLRSESPLRVWLDGRWGHGVGSGALDARPPTACLCVFR